MPFLAKVIKKEKVNTGKSKTLLPSGKNRNTGKIILTPMTSSKKNKI